jgi:hypothetical protein
LISRLDLRYFFFDTFGDFALEFRRFQRDIIKNHTFQFTLMSEKNRHGSEGGEASMLPDGVMSMLVERFTKRGRYFKGLLSASLTPKK